MARFWRTNYKGGDYFRAFSGEGNAGSREENTSNKNLELRSASIGAEFSSPLNRRVSGFTCRYSAACDLRLLRRIRATVSSTLTILAKATPSVVKVAFLISSTLRPPAGKVSVPSLVKKTW
jgi:hypothetical protein